MTSHTRRSPSAVYIGPRTPGYAFAYFRWICTGPEFRRVACNSGGSFCFYFSMMNPLTDETPLSGESK